MDDSKGQEKIGVHAQKDMETVVENNDDLHVKNDRTTKIDMNRTEEVGINVTEDIGATWKVKAGAMIEFKCGASKITMTPAMIQIKSPVIQIQADATLNAKGALTIVDGTATHIVKGGIVLIN